MFEVTLMDRKNTNELMEMLGDTIPVETMLRAAAVRCYGHVL